MDSIATIIGASAALITALGTSIVAIIKAGKANKTAETLLKKFNLHNLLLERDTGIYKHGVFGACITDTLSNDSDYFVELLYSALRKQLNLYAELLTNSRDHDFPSGVLLKCLSQVLLSDPDASKKIANDIVIAILSDKELIAKIRREINQTMTTEGTNDV